MTGGKQAAKNPCKEAAKTWKIKQLFLNLEIVLKQLKRDSKGLETWQKQYLCLLLSGYTPREIAQEHLHLTVESLRVKLSSKKGLYECIRRLTKKPILDWRDVIIILLHSGYRRNEASPPNREEIMLVIECDAELSEKLMRKLESTVHEVAGSNNLRIVRIEKGSVVFILQGPVDECDRVAERFNPSELSEKLGCPVREVKKVDNNPAPNQSQGIVSLAQWLKGCFDEPSWQPVEWIMAPSLRMATPALDVERGVSTESIRRAKIICWDTDERVLILVVHMMPTATQSLDVRLQLYPYDTASNLPPGLELSVQDETGVTCLEATARTADNWLQLEFSADPGEPFSVTIAIDSVRAVEHFST